jgi:hypothetical protein
LSCHHPPTQNQRRDMPGSFFLGSWCIAYMHSVSCTLLCYGAVQKTCALPAAAAHQGSECKRVCKHNPGRSFHRARILPANITCAIPAGSVGVESLVPCPSHTHGRTHTHGPCPPPLAPALCPNTPSLPHLPPHPPPPKHPTPTPTPHPTPRPLCIPPSLSLSLSLSLRS